MNTMHPRANGFSLPMINLYAQRRLLGHFFLATWLVLLFVTQDTINFAAAWAHGMFTTTFLITAWMSYCVIYLIPAMVLTRMVDWAVHRGHDPLQPGRRYKLVYGVAWLTTALTVLFMYANAKLYALYGIFVNGFVFNLITTPGGIQSLGGSSATTVGFVLIVLAFLLAQAALLGLVYTLFKHLHGRSFLPRPLFKILLAIFLMATISERAAYAYSDAIAETSVLTLSEGIPFYVGTTARSFLKKIGMKVKRQDEFQEIKGRLRYPLHPLIIHPPQRPLNVVWLAAESWRADTLDPEIMPRTWAFAQHANRFTRNYSGGNGTRVGVFTMFTGIPGNYWFPFLNEHQGAAIIEVMQRQNYQMQLYTSAKFSYPEFDRTIFRNIPAAQLHEADESQPGWKRDQINVSAMLDFIAKRDPNRPFFTFMFFESPHSRYYFPPESVIRSPYRDDINYATLDAEELARDIVPIKNRYLNAVHHLDSQFGRIFDYLEQNHLLDTTIVILLGDHGEEFMEHGYWGHNSTFVDPQTRTPLVLWVPGKAPGVHDKMTSHMDVVPTLMPLLGVTNPVTDYAIGFDLFSDKRRTATYLADWSRVAYVDEEVKIVMPIKLNGLLRSRISTSTDEPIPAERNAEIFARKKAQLVQLIQDMGHFIEKKR
ncbi:MAG: sulfatase-like hydrolase/transferase [Methylophilaceae bacterium]|nr:sulfatase-like hydrolase/transferase [Methylophilaceae bacterium]